MTINHGILDSFSGLAADLPPGKRTPENVLAALKLNPRVGSFDMSETPWLRRCIDSLKRSGQITECKNEAYPWHRFTVTDAQDGQRVHT